MGRAHYGRQFHGLVCYGTPIRGPDGQVVGVLDATSLRPHADDVVGAAVGAAAQAIEESLRARAYAGAGLSVARALLWALEQTRAPVLLVEPPGRIARGNAASRFLLDGLPAGGRIDHVLGLDWAALGAEALHPTAGGLTLPLGGRPRRLRTEPILGADGVLLSVLVILEPVASRPAPLDLAPDASPSRPAALDPTAASGAASTSRLDEASGAGSTAPRDEAPLTASDDPFGAIFAADASVEAAVRWSRRVAVSRLPVMLLAETGSGKELFAQAIHHASDRASGPFVAINCGALAPGLLESELFGHAPGAFTGADRRGRTGLLHAADRGTLFLDEVAEMTPPMQAALLRFLESGTYQRLGETGVSHADVRLICATCRDLPARVADQSFRQDLYYRLKGALLR
ncbi:MAG: sigma-54-dependent Fis family transcriptional regulator, partial [Myxococcales bacterium]